MTPPPPYDPFDPKTWPKPNQQNNPPLNQPPQNPYQQNPPPPPNPYQQNPYQQNPYQQNPYQQLPPWQLHGNMPFSIQREIPNSGGVLALGIISILGAFCYGVPGLICAIIGLTMGNTAINAYEMNPAIYTSSSYSNAKAGRVCAIIGLSISCLFILILIIAIVADARW